MTSSHLLGRGPRPLLRLLGLAVLPALLALAAAGPARAGHVYDGSREARLLFVQTAASATFDGRSLTLAGVPATVYFSDRPHRLYGQVDNPAFARFFRQTVQERFAGDPPNAALTLLEEGGRTVVVELVEGPEVKGDSLVYGIKPLSGAPPGRTGACGLFIDAFPTPVNGQITD